MSAGCLGASKVALKMAVEHAKQRRQFGRPIGEFHLIKQKIARMAELTFAMDALTYLAAGLVDQHDDDIMLETAMCKVFCSEYGFRCTNEAMQVMGGEGYMTENELERLWRDSRINPIVEGANEVMHSFIFAYGSKQLGEYMLGIKAAPQLSPGPPLAPSWTAGSVINGDRRTSKASALASALEKATAQLKQDFQKNHRHAGHWELPVAVVKARGVQESPDQDYTMTVNKMGSAGKLTKMYQYL